MVIELRDLIEGGYLGLWGIALLLVWSAALRLINQIHVLAVVNGWVKAGPRRVMAPMRGWSDIGVALVALACGGGGMLAFASIALHTLHLPEWLTPLTLPPMAELVRIALAWVVLVFFLTRVAESTWWKIGWALCWTGFAITLAVLT